MSHKVSGRTLRKGGWMSKGRAAIGYDHGYDTLPALLPAMVLPRSRDHFKDDLYQSIRSFEWAKR
jgi:hypothetical protein